MESGQPDGARRARGQIVVARALWYVKPGQAELRPERLDAPRPGEVRIKTRYSLISRGTERLVAHGEVPQSEWTRMQAPMQAGKFPFPVKYGYSATGIVTAGPAALIDRLVFCLHPHQDYFQVPEAQVVPVPDAVPARRATLAANMETALNAHWDAGTGPGDRILVIGAGIVGLLVAHLARRIAGTTVTVTDIDPARADAARKLGLPFTAPSEAPAGNRIVFHASASAAGLQTALDKAAFEGRIVELSWYGTAPVTVRLGGAFHSRRLQLISSQVGHVSPLRRAGTTPRDRLVASLSLLDDAVLDSLVTDTLPFEEVPGRLTQILAPSTSGLTPLIRYGDD